MKSVWSKLSTRRLTHEISCCFLLLSNCQRGLGHWTSSPSFLVSLVSLLPASTLTPPSKCILARHLSTVITRKYLYKSSPMDQQRNLSSAAKLTFNRAVVLTKFSRFEFERRRFPHLQETALKDELENKGSDFENLKERHRINQVNRENFVECLKKRNIETRVVDRHGYTPEIVDWADVIFSAGGDGTFLMAANKVRSPSKVVIGVNTDPVRSVGHLCVPSKYTDDWDSLLTKLINGEFVFKNRQRIRVILEGENAFDPPIAIHDQGLSCSVDGELKLVRVDQMRQRTDSDISHGSPPLSQSPIAQRKVERRTLPDLALNEVFVGESLSSRVSYCKVSFDGKTPFKFRSSGMTICTGTGSTSWSFNINKLTPSCVESLMNILNHETGSTLDTSDKNLIQKVTDSFNNSLIFDPSQERMAFTIRDPIVFRTGFDSNPRGFATHVKVTSRMLDGVLVLDGGQSYSFNNGSIATFQIDPEDALRTVVVD